MDDTIFGPADDPPTNCENWAFRNPWDIFPDTEASRQGPLSKDPGAVGEAEVLDGFFLDKIASDNDTFPAEGDLPWGAKASIKPKRRVKVKTQT